MEIMNTINLPDDLYIQLLKYGMKVGCKEPSDVIRRLLQSREHTSPSSKNGSSLNNSTNDLVTQGGRLPHGTKLRAKYKGRPFKAIVNNGHVVVEGVESVDLRSPSAAAIHVAKLMGTLRPSING